MSLLPKCTCGRTGTCDGSCTVDDYMRPKLPFIKTHSFGEECTRFPVVNDPDAGHNIIIDPTLLISGLLDYIGEDIERDGLKDTPKRYIKFLQEFLSPKPFDFTTFKNDGNDEMVVLDNIPFFSLCEHHMAPFFGTASIAYLPTDRIVGLSKLPRTLDKFARRLQNQERITTQVAEYLMEQLQPKGVAVVLKARHLCIEMRGIQKHDVFTTTSCMRGVFKTDMNCRQEFLKFVK